MFLSWFFLYTFFTLSFLFITSYYVFVLKSKIQIINDIRLNFSAAALFITFIFILSEFYVTDSSDVLWNPILSDPNNLNFSYVDLGDVTVSEFFSIYFSFIYAFILITLVTLLFCFSYNFKELFYFSLFVLFILVSGFGLFSCNSLYTFFIFYEFLLLPSFFILYKFAKTRKSVEAAFLMFFWTQFGALFLIFNFQYLFFISNSYKFSDLTDVSFSEFELNFLLITSLIGFGVKFPIWPFYDWLPKAHVEASTNFSIFLSGVLVKFAFFGFFRYITNLGIDLTPLWLLPFLLVGLLDSSFKIIYQLDIKKVIAYSTVIEMHWLLAAILFGMNVFWIAASAMLLSHALLSSALFLSIDFVTRRFKTRLTTELNGIFFLIPELYTLILCTLVIFLGFPGTLFFFAEFLFFTFLSDFNFAYFTLTFFLVYLVLPISFIKNWFLLLFGFKLPFSYLNVSQTTNKTYSSSGLKSDSEMFLDLDFVEKLLLIFILSQLVWLGFSFQFIFN